MNKTKVIATVGPVTSNKEMLKKLMKNGVDVFRINTSHGNQEFCKEIIEKVEELNNELKTNVAIMLDLKGPLIRTGKFENKQAFYKETEKIRIYNTPVLGDQTKFSVDYEKLTELPLNQIIKADDGKVEFIVLEKGENFLLCETIKGGFLSDYKSINIPDYKIKKEFLSQEDRETIYFANEYNVDFIALSFVRSTDDVLDVSDLLINLKNDHLGIISKIENTWALDEIDKIIKVSDGIMVARGDLGVELPVEKIPGIQKNIIKKCHKAGKISIVATELLSNMTETNYPTRAEVSDIANAILDGTDAVMLSGETTIGKYPLEALQTMERIIKSAELDIDYEHLQETALKTEEITTTGSIAYAAANCASNLKCKAIFTPTNSGATAKKISRFRPNCPIIAISPDEKTVKSLALNFGVCAYLINELKTIDSIIEKSKKFSTTFLNLKQGDKILITGGYPFKKIKYTNFMQIDEI